jgi:hypothetical protein
VRAVEWWQQRRRPARAASMAAEEAGRVESSGELESFVLKRETPHGRLLFIG